MQLPTVQTWAAQRAAGYLSDRIGTKVEIKGVDIKFFDTVVLEGVYIEDQKKDTLLYTGKMFVSIKDFSLSAGKFDLNKITLYNTTIGIKKYADEDGLNFQFIADAFKPTKKDTTPSKPFVLTCQNITLVNNIFSYQIMGKTPPEWGFDASNIVAHKLNGDFTGFILHGDTIEANVAKLSAVEKSGLMLRSMDCKFMLTAHEMLFDKLNLKSNNCDVHGRVEFDFNSMRAFANPFDSVRVNIDLENTAFHLGDMAYFAPTLRGAETKATVAGHFTGRISKLKGKDVAILYGNNTKFYGDVIVKGLPNSAETFIEAEIKQLVTNAADVATLQIPPYNEKVYVPLTPEVYRLGMVSFKGKYRGFFTDFVANGTFNTALGTASTDLRLAKIPGQDEMEYSGSLTTQNFKLGDLLPGQSLGIVSVNADVEGKGFDLKSIDTKLKGHVTAFDYNSYRYQNIDFNGRLVKTEFTGGVTSLDPNMQLAFDGTMSFGKDVPVYNFEAKVVRADLTALNFIDKDSSLIISAKLQSNITGNTIESLNGKITANDVSLQYGTTVYDVGEVSLYSDVASKPKQMRLISSIADLNIIGEYELTTLPKSVIRTLNTFMPSYYMVGQGSKGDTIKTQDFSFTAHLKNMDAITSIFVPDLKVSPGARLQGNYKSTSDRFVLSGMVPGLDIAGVKMSGLNISSNTVNRTLFFNTTFDTIEPVDSVYLNAVNLNMSTRNDSLYTHIDFVNTFEDTIHNSGEIEAIAHFSDATRITINFTKTEVNVFDYKWTINKDNKVTIDSNRVDINKLVFETAGESFRVFGRVSKKPEDQLNVIFTKFNMANANRFIPDNIVQLKGTISGSVSVSNILNRPFFRSNVKVYDMYVNDTEIGSGNINSEWDREHDVINVHSLLSRGTVKTISVDGKFYPNEKEDNLDFDIDINKIRLTAINPYLKGTLTFLGTGTASAGLKVNGDLKKLRVTGDVSVIKANALIDYLGASYSFTHNFKLLPTKIPVENLVLSDNDGHNATVNGEVTHKEFDDWHYNVSMKLDNFRCLNTNENQNSLYYGLAYVTGTVKIDGNIDNTYMNVVAKTNPRTRFNIPLSSPSSASSSDFITFVDRNEKAKGGKVQKPKTRSTGIVLDMDLEVTPDAEVKIIFDKQVGDEITGRGFGNISMKIDTKSDFTMNGLYTIEQGQYLFTLKNLVNKYLKVEKGGTVKWTKSPYDAQIDITALYDVKASLQPIMVLAMGSQETEQYKRRVPVQCRLGMDGNLMSPNLKFGITSGADDVNAKTALAAVQANQEELSRQFFSLLILNTFLPPAQGGLVASQAANYTAGLGNNGFELLSSQLNVFLSKISDDFDINVNYRPGENGAGPQAQIGGTVNVTDFITLDASVSYNGAGAATSGSSGTGGSGGTGSIPNQNASNIVSDFNLEVRASKDGRLKFKAFNRSNPNIIAQSEAPYVQGVGISYRREFNSFKDLFKRKKPKKTSTPPPANTPPTTPAVTPADNNGKGTK